MSPTSNTTCAQSTHHYYDSTNRHRHPTKTRQPTQDSNNHNTQPRTKLQDDAKSMTNAATMTFNCFQVFSDDDADDEITMDLHSDTLRQADDKNRMKKGHTAYRFIDDFTLTDCLYKPD